MARYKERNYSKAYDNFVTDDADILGLVAYGLFKDAKVKDARKFYLTNSRDWYEHEALDWSNTHSEPHHVSLYNSKAEEILKIYADHKLEEEKDHLREEVKNEPIRLIEQTVAKLTGWPGFWGGVGTNIGGAIVWVVVTAAVILVQQHPNRNEPESPPPQARVEQPSPK